MLFEKNFHFITLLHDSTQLRDNNWFYTYTQYLQGHHKKTSLVAGKQSPIHMVIIAVQCNR